MNWKWLIPVMGLIYLFRDDLDNVANDYMKYRLPLGLLYQFCIFSILVIVFCYAMNYYILGEGCHYLTGGNE